MLRSDSELMTWRSRQCEKLPPIVVSADGGWSGLDVAKSQDRKSSGRRLQVDYMTRTERVMAAVSGGDLDRVPVCFWHHFQPEGSGRAMAEATLRFFDEEFDLDIAKVMPDL